MVGCYMCKFECSSFSLLGSMLRTSLVGDAKPFTGSDGTYCTIFT